MKNTIPKKIPVLFSRPKKIPASFIDPRKSLLAKMWDPKKSFGPPPSLKFVSGAPGVEWLLTSECVFNPLNPDISIFPPPWLSFPFPKVLMKRISLTTKTLSNSPSFCIYLQSRPLIFMDHSFFSYKRCVLLHSVALGGNIVFGVCFESTGWVNHWTLQKTLKYNNKSFTSFSLNNPQTQANTRIVGSKKKTTCLKKLSFNAGLFG